MYSHVSASACMLMSSWMGDDQPVNDSRQAVLEPIARPQKEVSGQHTRQAVLNRGFTRRWQGQVQGRKGVWEGSKEVVG